MSNDKAVLRESDALRTMSRDLDTSPFHVPIGKEPMGRFKSGKDPVAC